MEILGMWHFRVLWERLSTPKHVWSHLTWQDQFIVFINSRYMQKTNTITQLCLCLSLSLSLSLSLPVSVSVSACLSLSLPVCRCLSLSLPVSLSPSLSISVSENLFHLLLSTLGILRYAWQHLTKITRSICYFHKCLTGCKNLTASLKSF